MQTKLRFFSWISGIFGVLGVCAAYAASVANPRSYGSENMTRLSNHSGQTRSATNRSRAGSSVRGAVTDAGMTRMRAATLSRDNSSLARTAARSGQSPVVVSGVVRTSKATNNSRMARGTTAIDSGLARSGIARATAVFNDITKIGSGYSACRESYATCMDQICAEANDSYRRCFCSDRFAQFRDTENALDQAMIMLQQFQDNNLDAVDKTAAEVEAMYTATVGEQAIKRDTSAAAQMLENINNLLDGKKSTSLSAGASTSLGILDLDFSSDLGDIWSGGDASSIFSSGEIDLSTLEGTALFNAAQNQCVRLSQNNCENDAVFSMSKSSYNILINQDCNIYEKTLNTKREKVAAAVRMAEKYLREARLEEYRSHNSADVNECVAKVRTAILADTACGENYKRCLDPTGAYIDTNGNAIYTPRLFELEDMISLGGWNSTNQDILVQNQRYDKYLDGYRKYVTRELNTCRDIADFVWTEFKRNAIIEIAQAQSEKIEEEKSSCVNTIAQCYDSTTQQLASMDKNTATATGAIGRYAATNMCAEDVATCALLWAPKGVQITCNFDGRGHITSGDAEACGLASLVNYVQTVDSLNLVSKCADAIDEYVTNLCTPTTGNRGYPYECRNMNSDAIASNIRNYAIANCMDPTAEYKDNFDSLDPQIQTKVELLVEDVRKAMRNSLGNICESLGGLWYEDIQTGDELVVFYSDVFGRGQSNTVANPWGYCYENSDRLKCESYNYSFGDDIELTSWDSATETCTFYYEWYKYMCEEVLSGYYESNMCYVGQ